jgi:hypothetical protein
LQRPPILVRMPCYFVPEWRNWQTRTVQGRVGFG